jgi:hypothetical protein
MSAPLAGRRVLRCRVRRTGRNVDYVACGFVLTADPEEILITPHLGGAASKMIKIVFVQPSAEMPIFRQR